MPRKRSLIVEESGTHIRAVEAKHRGMPTAQRLHALRLLQSNPRASAAAIASEVGVSKATLERWIALYKRGGLAGLLAMAKPGRRIVRKLPPKIVSQLARRYG